MAAAPPPAVDWAALRAGTMGDLTRRGAKCARSYGIAVLSVGVTRCTAVGHSVSLQWRRPKHAPPLVEGLLATADEASGLLGVVRVHVCDARARQRYNQGGSLLRACA